MFELRNYILKLLDEAIGKKPDWKVRELALSWYEKDVLILEDLEAVDLLIEEKNSKKIENSSSVEEIPEENAENIENSAEENTENTAELTVDEILSENNEEPLILE